MQNDQDVEWLVGVAFDDVNAVTKSRQHDPPTLGCDPITPTRTGGSGRNDSDSDGRNPILGFVGYRRITGDVHETAVVACRDSVRCQPRASALPHPSSEPQLGQ